MEDMILTKQLPSKLDIVSNFIDDVICALQQGFPLNGDQVFDIRLVLEEALTNAIKHGNQNQVDLFVDVNITQEGRKLTFKIGNQGKGFDPEKVPDPTQGAGLLRTSGRGVFLIRKIMDEVAYQDNGRVLVMAKIF